MASTTKMAKWVATMNYFFPDGATVVRDGNTLTATYQGANNTVLEVTAAKHGSESFVNSTAYVDGEPLMTNSIQISKGNDGTTVRQSGAATDGQTTTSYDYLIKTDQTGALSSMDGSFTTETGQTINVSSGTTSTGAPTVQFTSETGQSLGEYSLEALSKHFAKKGGNNFDGLLELQKMVEENAPEPEPEPELISAGFTLSGTSSQSLTVQMEQGDELEFQWRFNAQDYLPYDDRAYVNDVTLSSVSQVGDYGDSGWNSYSYTASSAGSYEFVFGIDDVGDELLASTLEIQDVFLI